MVGQDEVAALREEVEHVQPREDGLPGVHVELHVHPRVIELQRLPSQIT